LQSLLRLKKQSFGGIKNIKPISDAVISSTKDDEKGRNKNLPNTNYIARKSDEILIQ
jgi:hypothetical protein